MGKRDYKSKKLLIPYYPKNDCDNKENPYVIESIEEKTISKYLNISLLEVDELTIIEYKFYLREAFIYNCSMTEEGIEYLQNAKRLETSSPDRENLRRYKESYS